MADVITRLKVESAEYDSKIKRAAQGLLAMEDACRKVGGTLAILEKEDKDFVASLGQMETVSKDARGKINELTKAFTDLSLQYRRLTDEEKKGDFGTALKSSLDQLKTRINDTKKDLAAINQELSGSKFGQFGSIIDGIGHKMGLTAKATELLTSKTALMYAGISAGIAIVYKATDAWVKYNQELAKQDQITTVTTGLKGTEADYMTDTMRALSDTYKVDFREAINAANTLMSQFGKTGDEAIQLIKDGMQGMIMGDGPKLLQMIQQYAPAFRDAGVSASQLVAVIHNTQGGLFSEDNMSAIVMGMKNIRLMTKQTSEALAKLGIDGQQMAQQLNDGTITVFDALKQVAGELRKVDSNSQEAGQVMQSVFGRQGVTAGMNIAKAIEELNTNLDETKTKTGELGDAFVDLQEANERLNVAIRECFEYDGWEQMATGIKSNLVTALSVVLETLTSIKTTWDTLLANIGVKGNVPMGFGAFGLLTWNANQNNGTTEPPLPTRTDNLIYPRRSATEYVNELMNSSNKRGTYEKQLLAFDTWISEKEKRIEKLSESAAFNDPSYHNLFLESQQKELSDLQQKRAEYVEQAKTIIEKEGKNNNNNNNNNKQTPQRQAQAKYDKAQKDYSQALEAAALAVKSGQADTVSAKKKELSAAESLWKAIGDAREIYDSDAFKTAQEDAAKKVVELGGSVNALVEEQKKAQEAARKLASAQEKAATAYQQMQQALQDNNLKAYNTALKQYQTAQADVQRLQASIPELPKPQGGKVVYTVEVNDVQLEKLKSLPTEDKTIKVNVEEGKVNLPLLPKDDQTIRFNVEQGNVNLPDIPKDDQTIRFNVEQGNVDLPQMPEKTYTVTIEAATEVAAVKVEELVAGMNAEKVTIPVAVDQPKPVEMPVEMSYTDNNMSAFLSTLKERIAQEDIGSTLYNNLTAQLADANALANLMQTAIKNGIDISQFNPQDLWSKVFGQNPGDYISDEQLEEIRKKIEEAIGKPIKLDLNSGQVNVENKQDKITQESRADFNKITGSLSTITGALQQIGVEIPEGFSKTLGVLQIISTITMAIQALTTVTATTSALKSIPIVGMFLNNGGVVHAANGWAGTVPGNSFSGDNVPAMLNSGEVVLTRAMASNLASQLSSNNAGATGRAMATIESDQIKIVLQNGAQSRGMTLSQYLEL